MQRVIVCDTETASLKGPVVDFAFVEIDSELNIIREVQSLIDPQCPIQAGAQAVHGISDEMVADAPTMAEYIENYGNPFTVDEGDDLVFIAHNAQFDFRMLKAVLPPRVTQICTLRMSRNMWPDLPEGENHQLGTLAVKFKLERGVAHRAMGDVITCLNLLRHLAAVGKVGSFEELLELGKRSLTLEAKMTFGKHKGTKLKDLDMGYVSWMLRQPDMDPELLAALATRTNRSS